MGMREDSGPCERIATIVWRSSRICWRLSRSGIVESTIYNDGLPMQPKRIQLLIKTRTHRFQLNLASGVGGPLRNRW